MHRSISVEQRVAITLWCLATPAEYRTVAHLFGVARSTVCEIVHETCETIVSNSLNADLKKWGISWRSGGFLSVLDPLTDAIFPFLPLLIATLTIITRKATID